MVNSQQKDKPLGLMQNGILTEMFFILRYGETRIHKINVCFYYY